MSKSEKIRLALLEGGKTALEIARDVGCSREYASRVSRKLGIGSERGARGRIPSTPEPYTKRSVHVIRVDLARQLEGIVRRFEASL